MVKILIVDDEKISLMMTEHILSSQYQTICALSGQEALTLYRQERPDMIVSDLRMPGMNGYELLESLQKEFHETIPVMFMTADNDDHAEAKAFESGAAEFIRKPFRADVLLKRVSNIIKTRETIKGLTHAAVTDPMTGLLNKASFQAELQTMLGRTPGALMIIDLDSFKPVNDIYGHDKGDAILIRFAEILRSAIRQNDLAGRAGGDEFIAFCQNITDETVIAEKASYINENLLSSAAELLGEDISIPLGASIGCVFTPEEGTAFQDLFQKADKALRSVKQNGKHGYAVCRDSEKEAEQKESYSSDLTNLMQILGERNQPKGAFCLSFEQFQLVYRFLVRIYANYQDEAWLLLFSLDESGFLNEEGHDHSPSLTLKDAMEQFQFALGASLRQSDVIAQSGKNQFLVILLKISPLNIETVTDRIIKNWADVTASRYYDISYEIEKLT